jgi:hypothetical protein
MEPVARSFPRARALPIIYTKTPVIGVPPEALYKNLLEGNNPETGKPVVDEIIDVLTKSQEERKIEPTPVYESEPCSSRSSTTGGGRTGFPLSCLPNIALRKC